MDVEVIFHGTTIGHETWGTVDENENDFYLHFYKTPSNEPEFMKFELRPYNSQYCYYTFIKAKNVYGAEGRSGSYFGITLRMDVFYSDILGIYNILKAAYEKKCVGLCVEENNNSIKYLIDSFQKKDSELKKVTDSIIDYIGTFTVGNDIFDLAKFNPTGSKVCTINLNECTKKIATDCVQKFRILKVSPYYPTSSFKAEINKLENEKEEIERQKEECEQRINELEQSLKDKNSELSSMQQLCKEKEDKLEVKNQKVQNLENEVDRLDQDKRNAEQKLQETKQAKDECERNIGELSQRLEEKDIEISSLEKKCEELKGKEAKLNNKIKELQNVKEEEEKGIQENVCEPKINEPEQSHATAPNDDSMQQPCKEIEDEPKTENKKVQNLEMEVDAQNQEQEPQKTEQVKDECEHNIGEHNQRHKKRYRETLNERIGNKKQKNTGAQTDNRPNNPNNQRPTEEQPYQPSNTNLNNSNDSAGSNDKPDNEEGKDCEGGNGKKKGLLERIKNFFIQLLKQKPKTRNAASQMPEKNSTKQ